MSRIENTSKNFIYTFLSTFLTSILGFVTRTVFISEIGVTYLGANSLFTNILSMLSLTELGVGTSIAFSLYKPLAHSDKETIKSLMCFYKKAYKVIAGVILVLGLLLLPFLEYVIKDPGDMKHIPLIYLVYLYNTVVSYMFSYKVTLLCADQKAYLQTNINMVTNVITSIVQLVVMFCFKNYFFYLFTGTIIGTVQWFYINRFVNNRYPYLKEKKILPLDVNLKKEIKTNVKAMMFHKLGDLCINQTDNIIISSFISITTVGIYNNYYMIINIINNLALSFLNSATASFGNLIATETKDKRYEIFKKYNFMGFWIFGVSGICLYTLLNSFVTIWLGEKYLIDKMTLAFVMINYYLVGMRTTIGNIKMSAGLYSQDQWVPIVQSIINLTVSIIGAKYLGLAGVFLGTVVSSLCIPCWYRPVIVYKHVFEKPVGEYFLTYIRYACTVLFNLGIVSLLCNFVEYLVENIYVAFVAKGIICAAIPNLVIVCVYKGTDEFQYVLQLIRFFINKVKMR